MEDEGMDQELLDRLRTGYHAPPETPRDEMWAAIRQGMEGRSTDEVVSLAEVRRRRHPPAFHRSVGWAVAAAALLVLGVGIGRMTAPSTTPDRPVAVEAGESDNALRLAAVEHLGRTGSLLTLVRADARAGNIDPAAGEWARSLLTETRLLLDSTEGGDPTMQALLEDLELVLVQIVGVVEDGADDQGRIRTEMDLAVRGMEENEVLSRIQAVMPAAPGMAGT